MLRPNRLLMQFHVTGRCNLRCKHCYRLEGNVQPLSTENVKSIILQYNDLLNAYNANNKIRCNGQINLTGGEPFIREDICEIIEFIGSFRQTFGYAVLSNGSFIDEEIIRLLKSTNAAFVQLSIDGDEATHNYLRAEGDYERVFKTAEMLETNGVKTYISFTANAENYRFLPEVARECRRRKITKLWTDRIVPIGNGTELADLAITSDVLPSYLKALKKAQGGVMSWLCYPKTAVTSNRALQFLGTKGSFYSCSAAKSLITVDEFGNVMPCRRMPIICGNALDSTLTEIYYNNEVFKGLRGEGIPEECMGCKYSYICRGGAKCQSYAAYNRFDRADPACPIAKK